MTETNKREEKGKKKSLSLQRPGRLELKKTVKVGQVRQSFSHGRTKAVTVEVRKKRTFSKDSQGDMTEVIALPEGVEAPELMKEEALGGVKLTETERMARARALQGAGLPEGETPPEGEAPPEVSETPVEEVEALPEVVAPMPPPKRRLPRSRFAPAPNERRKPQRNGRAKKARRMRFRRRRRESARRKAPPGASPRQNVCRRYDAPSRAGGPAS